MISSLTEIGYDSSNSNHHLLVLGDLFDRGESAIEVLEYLYDLNNKNKATLILGNHDLFLLDFLEKKYNRVNFNIKFNGFGKTLHQLSGVKPNDDNHEEIMNLIINRFPYLYDWLKTFPLYLEIENYIFVHGGIDGSIINWKTKSSLRDFVWSKEVELQRVDGKITVAGHHRVATIRKKTENYELLFLQSPELFDIMYLEGKILIDRYVEVSKQINVLVLRLKGLI